MQRTLLQPTVEDPLEVVIDRKLWYRGKGAGGSRLLTEEGKMCCLGFDALACGLKAEDILYITSPGSTGYDVPGLVNVDTYHHDNSKVCGEMMMTNDNEVIADGEREKLLTEMAATIGRKFVFVG